MYKGVFKTKKIKVTPLNVLSSVSLGVVTSFLSTKTPDGLGLILGGLVLGAIFLVMRILHQLVIRDLETRNKIIATTLMILILLPPMVMAYNDFSVTGKREMLVISFLIGAFSILLIALVIRVIVKIILSVTKKSA